MKQRYVLAALLTVLVVFAGSMRAQTPGGAADVTGVPRITCSVWTSADKLFFRGNDYLPNTITITITVRNISTDTARTVTANMVADTRFNIEGLPVKLIANELIPGDSASTTFDLHIASPRTVDGWDTVRTLVTTTNGAFADCEQPIWVEHEYMPKYQPQCSRLFGQIVFDDNINNYSPNPFKVQVDLANIGDGGSDSTLIQYLGTRGVSVDPSSSSIVSVGTLGPSGTTRVEFNLQAIKRTNDTTVTICFQVQGKGGYKRKTYVDSCCVDVFIPLAKQAVYDLKCDVLPDSIEFRQHAYTPDPFRYNVNIRNIGTANGKNVRVQLIMPPSLQMDTGQTIIQSLGDINVNGTASVYWMLRPAERFKRDTVHVCARVFDEFDNSATCCDSVVVDSIRAAQFSVICMGPDSLKVDASLGIYAPDSFLVHFLVTNVGSDYADSVKATIIIQNPDVVCTELPFFATKTKAMLSGTDTLSVTNNFDFTWMLRSLRRAVSGPVTIKFVVEARNAIAQECTISIFIPQLDAPDISLACEIDPTQLDVGLNGYIPSEFIYRLNVTNPGGSAADSVWATINLPPGLSLKTGQTPEKFVMEHLAPKATATVVWVLVPVARHEDSLRVTISATTRSKNVDGVFSINSDCSITIPLLPFTAALQIPSDPVGFYGGSNIEVPVYIDDPANKKITSFDFEILYNVYGYGTSTPGAPLPEKVVDLASPLGIAPCSSGLSATQRPLTCDWDVNAVAVSDNLLRITAQSRGGAFLGYPTLNPGQPAPPLMVLLFKPVYGAAPNHMKTAFSSLLWPMGETEVKNRVLINNGAIRALVVDGALTVSGDCLRPLIAGDKYAISQNKPNPFNPSTTIEYQVPERTHVRIHVFDTFGRTVEMLVDSDVDAGRHLVNFNASNLPSGVYFYRMDATGYSRTMKMIVAK